jgi:hypothetical protein
MKLPHLKVCRSIRKLHQRFLRAENEQIATTARQKIEAKLAKHGLKWEDLDAVLKKADKADRHKEGEPNVLTLIRSLTVKYIWMTEEERWAYPLWVLHTYVYKRYNKTPRLAILSPVAGCGKTELMKLTEQLVNNPSPVYVNVSPALVYRLIDEAIMPPTLLLDEGDNLGIFQNPVLRAVLNANRQGSPVGRAMGSGAKAYSTFTPIVIAAIGKLTHTLTQRSIIINMQRYPKDAPPLDRLNELDPEFQAGMGLIRDEIRKWVNTCNLDPDPDIPVINRCARSRRALPS